jgi:hypothetical protein
MAGSIFIPLISVFDAKGINQAKSGMASLATSVKNLKGAAAGAAASFAAVGATKFVKDSVTAARDLERNMVGLGNVFGNLAPQMQNYSKDAAAIGLSQVEASKASTFLGSVLKQSGFEMGVVASETQNLVGLAADLSATYGYDLSEALTGMTALFRGEYDPIEKFGVAMKQSEVNALLAARGQKNLTGATLRQAQAQARLDILYARSQDAQGAYAQQSGSLFVVQTQLKAAFDNLKASLGASLTGPLASFLSNFVPLMDKLGVTLTPLFENLGKVLERLGPVLASKAENMLAFADAVNPVISVLTELIVPLLTPLAGIFGVLTQVITPFIPLITFLAQVIKAVLMPVVTMLNFIFMVAIKTIGKLFEGLSQLGGVIPGLGGFFKDAGKNLNDFSNDFDKLNGLMADTTVTNNELTSSLSKTITGNPIDVVAKAAEKASKGIQKASDALNQFLEDAVNIQKSIIGSANITGLLDESSNEIVRSITYLNGQFKVVSFGASKSATDIAGAFKANLNKIKEFYKNLQILSKSNLDDSLIQQLVSAGPDAGNATAQAIIASGKEGITSLNKTANGIKKVAGDIGVLGAQAMKNAGTNVGNGLIDGLYAQQARLVTAAQDIGTAIGNALGGAVSDAAVTSMTAAEKLKAGTITMAEFIKITSAGKPLSTNTVVGPRDSYSPQMPEFISSYKAGIPGAGISGGYKLMNVKDIYNPFASENGTFNNKGYEAFQANQAKASEYNISINVAPGASGAQIGQAMVNAIQEYERVKGKGWRN